MTHSSKVTSMKMISFMIFTTMAAASSCLAQSTISVTFSNTTTGAPCTFTATSVSGGFFDPIVLGNNISGKPQFGPIMISKNLDSCTIPLTMDVFKAGMVNTVTITMLLHPLTPITPPALVLTLTNAVITSISDTGTASGGQPAEQLKLVFETIGITTRIQNSTGQPTTTTLTCSVVSNSCG